MHAHSLFLDGVYVRDSIGALAFRALGAPTFEEVEQVAQWTHARIVKVLLAHGRTLDGLDDEPAELTHAQPVLASCYAASAADLQLLGDNAGQKTLKLVQPVRAVRSGARALAAFGGVNVHAEVAIDGRDRQRLEHVLRYMARPPLALDRLSLREHGAQERSDEHPGTGRLSLQEGVEGRDARRRALARGLHRAAIARRSEATSTLARWYRLRAFI